MAELTILNKLVQTDEMFGLEGWKREPVTKKLQIPDKIIQEIFPAQNEEICITAFVGDEPVGHCDNNSWQDFLEMFPKNLERLENHDDQNVKNFVNLLKQVYEAEYTMLVPYLKEQGFTLDQVAHCSGLMVMQYHCNKGIGKKLIEFNDNFLRQKGYKVVVAEATNEISRKIFENNGYEEDSYVDLQEIGIEDRYSVMFKILV